LYCPRCGIEFREGFSKCSDCNIDLVSDPPSFEQETIEWRDMVTIKIIDDQSFLMVAKSIIESAEIPFFTKNEGVQELFGFGRVGTGFNIAAGPIEIQVPKEYAEEALTLLESAEQDDKNA